MSERIFNNRTFSVCNNSAHSDNFPVDKSMPQGTKLGLLMYILIAYDIAKLFKFVKIKITYADDISLYAVVHTPVNKIGVQNELNLLHNLVSL